MALLDRITIEPAKMGGRPCIRRMRMRVTDVLEMLADGASQAEILRDYPDLEAEDIRAAIAYAAVQLNHPVIMPDYRLAADRKFNYPTFAELVERALAGC